jgi:hypothetical protein
MTFLRTFLPMKVDLPLSLFTGRCAERLDQVYERSLRLHCGKSREIVRD